MRTWGRVPSNGPYSPYSSAIGYFDIGNSPIEKADNAQLDYTWVGVETDPNGYNDAVWLTALSQVLQLNLNESPIFGNWGIPSQQSAITQVFPDYYVMIVQQQFSEHFLSLIISKIQANDPEYNINVTANPGALLSSPVPI